MRQSRWMRLVAAVLTAGVLATAACTDAGNGSRFVRPSGNATATAPEPTTSTKPPRELAWSVTRYPKGIAQDVAYATVVKALTDKGGWQRADLKFKDVSSPLAQLQVELYRTDEIAGACRDQGRNIDLGCAYGDKKGGKCRIKVSLRLKDGKPVPEPGIAAHEIGHCFLGKHVPGDPLMRPCFRNRAAAAAAKPTNAEIRKVKTREEFFPVLPPTRETESCR